METKVFQKLGSKRRGVTAVIAAIGMITLLAFAAMTIDVGVMFNARADAQRTVDASALAGVLVLLDQDRLKDGNALESVIYSARAQVSTVAVKNAVLNVNPIINSGDISVGYLTDPNDPNEPLATDDPTRYNAIRVVVRRDQSANGAIDLFFARIFGRYTTDVSATATAAAMDGIEGFRVTEKSGNAGLLPIALKDESWFNLLSGAVTTGDNYSYDEATGTVSPGPDGIEELNLYPGSGNSQLPPGNLGTVDIGSPDNSTADVSRQITEGVNQTDLDYFGGEIRLGPDGTLPLNGETGLSAGIANELASIIGQPRTIPIFSTVAGPGNNATFTIVGWVGVRVMHVQLTGKMSKKGVIIQPAVVIDDAVITGVADGSSYFVYAPVRIVR